MILVPGTLTVEPGRVDSGERVFVRVNVSNEGGVEGSVKVVLTLDGKDIQTRDILVLAGETEELRFSPIVERDVGTHTVEVAVGTKKLVAEFTVTTPAPLGVTIPLIVIFALVTMLLSVLMYARRSAAPGRLA